jgi:hypothetical protein
MWNELLVKAALTYPTAILTAIEPAGYPVSVRCKPVFDEANQQVRIPRSAFIPEPSTKASLLFHRHREGLLDQCQLMIKGKLIDGDGELLLQNLEFITGTGSQTTDKIPYANAPIELFRFWRLGRRSANAYLAKRKEPWPPIPFDEMLQQTAYLYAKK